MPRQQYIIAVDLETHQKLKQLSARTHLPIWRLVRYGTRRLDLRYIAQAMREDAEKGL